MSDIIKRIPYKYNNVPVPGGGFVTGFVFHPKEKNILYARTDIGGVYRYDFKNQAWVSLMDHVTALGKWESYPLSVAVDENNPNRLYIIAGLLEDSFLCVSEDRGETFHYKKLPAPVHGNAPGRGTGERLAIDPLSGNIYLGTQTDGLFVSDDSGNSWKKLEVKPSGGKAETDIAFVWLAPLSRGNESENNRTIVVSTSGKCNSLDGSTRSSSLYVSFDSGKTFETMPGQPLPPDFGNYPGYVGQRAAFGNGRLYVTMSAVEHSRTGFSGYACDSGGIKKGCIIEYKLGEKAVISHRDITPDNSCGYGGICAFSGSMGKLICTTQGAHPEAVYISDNGGDTWRVILRGLKTGKINFDVPYMQPKYNGGGSILHWLSDIKTDPFDNNRAVFNTGTGIFITENLETAFSGGEAVFRSCCKGLEETVHLNVYSPPSGNKHLIDIIGDLGGFAFSDLTKPAENSFANENGDRYITCLNADYPDENPQLVVVTARGNWSGRTTGGLILSENQCDTWTRLNDPVGMSEKIDGLIANIRKPNTNAGWTAISADGKIIVWCVGERLSLPSDAVVFTEDFGQTWKKSVLFDLEGKVKTNSTLKVISDRINPMVFYGFGNESLFYVSVDGAKTFHEIKSPDNFPKVELSGVDGRMYAEIRAESGKNVVWIATGNGGLWRIDYSRALNPCQCGGFMKPEFKRVTKEGDRVFRQGMGKEKNGSYYKTLYINGVINGEYGFWRSFDEGLNFTRINSDRQMFGDIRSIAGDPRVFGRFYIATGSRGVLWGEPIDTDEN